MKTHIVLNAIDWTSASDLTEETLEKAPAHLVTFLEGMTKSRVRDLMHPYGWTDARADECYALLTQLAGLSTASPEAPEDLVAAAAARCDAFMANDFVRVEAMVALRHPDQATFLFHGLAPSTGVEAQLAIGALVERVAVLRNGAGRKGTRQADHAALAIMESAGVGQDELSAIAEDMALARTVDAFVTPEPAPEIAARVEARLTLLRKIHALHGAWSTVARTVVTTRRDLIELGLAKRKASKPKKVAPPVAPTPVAPAAPVATPADDGGPASRAA